MTESDFTNLVNARANKAVQERIVNLRMAIFRDVVAADPSVAYATISHPHVIDIIEATAKSLRGEKNVFPARLWREEEARVRDALLATMDTMQKALIDASKPSDPNDESPKED